jgi:hypothetical protein
MYKLSKNPLTQKIDTVIDLERMCAIPFDPANNDYANFKKSILEDKAQLQDAEGKQMSAEQAKQFIRELP